MILMNTEENERRINSISGFDKFISQMTKKQSSGAAPQKKAEKSIPVAIS